MSAGPFVVRTSHGTLLAADPETARFSHAETDRSGFGVVALRRGADCCVLSRRDGGLLRFEEHAADRRFLPFLLVAGADGARFAFRDPNGRFLTASPGGAVLTDRTVIAGWELFALESDEASAALPDLLADDDAVSRLCLATETDALSVASVLLLLPAERRHPILATLAGHADVGRIFATVRRVLAGGRERSVWHARTHLKGGIDAHGWIVGDHSYGTPTVIDGEFGSLAIGRYCSIAGDVRIIVANHAVDRVTTYPFAALHRLWPSAPEDASDHTSDGVVIGHDVWIGQGATILPGARIGDGAIVGAAAVVRKTVPPFAVMVGNPARVVRRRFDDETIERLLRVAWWHWPDEQVDRFVPLLLGGDVARFLALAEAAPA